jgi:hypothetical protein
MGLQDGPLFIRQIGGVGFSSHETHDNTDFLNRLLDKRITRCLKSALKDKRRKRPGTLQKMQTAGVR